MESVGKGFVGEHRVFGNSLGRRDWAPPWADERQGLHLGEAWGQGIITGTVFGLEVLGISCYFGHGGRRFVVSIFLRLFLADG